MSSSKKQQPLLTPAEKSALHKESEKRRRNDLQEEQDRLAKIVPGASKLARSEGPLLAKTCEYVNEQGKLHNEIVRLALESGWTEEQINEVCVRHERAARAEEDERHAAKEARRNEEKAAAFARITGREMHDDDEEDEQNEG